MANGNFGGGDGTALNPYLVEDAHDLDAVRNYLGDETVHFKQVANIDLSSWGNWEPIQYGTSTSDDDVFRGNYDGGGYKISNMTCQHSRDNVGLFGYIDSATIKNVFVENCDVIGNDYTGSLVGEVYSSTIFNCYSSGSVSAEEWSGELYGDWVGGLIGGISSGSTISNCYFKGDVNGYSRIGGLIGGSNSGSTISNCYFSGNVSGDSYVGGLIGYILLVTILNCYSSGSVNGIDSSIGGLVGSGAALTMSNCYSSSSVIGAYNVAGLVGGGSGKISNCYALNPFIARTSDSSDSSFSDITNSNLTTIENCFSLDTLEFRQL